MSAKITRRQYLMRAAIIEGVPTLMVREAVSSIAIEHPEWDMDEQHTWNEWETGEYN